MARPKLYEDNAARQAAYRARKGLTLSVVIPPDCLEAFNAYVERQKADGPGLTQSQIIERLIRSQVMRKR